MLINKNKHELIMVNILRDIYNNIKISSLLGFKGGTALYFLYNLDRFSVDLDFDLLKINEENKKIVFNEIEKIIKKYGEIKDSYIKLNTIFFMLSYGENNKGIKIEISTRKTKDQYEIKDFLGVSILICKAEYMFTNKLVALLGRKTFANRDIFDIYFFFKNNFEFNKEYLEEITKIKTKEYFKKCIKKIQEVEKNKILDGLGEVVDEKRKNEIKENLQKSTIGYLKMYVDKEL